MIPLLAAAIPAVASLAGGAINAISGAATNRSNQAFSERMYNQQNADAIKFWNMENEYNSPQAQMARLGAAGLNPNLVYGNSAVAGNTTSAPRVASAPQGNARPTDPGQGLMQMGNILGMYQDFQLKQAQTDNVKAQAQILAEQARGLHYDNLYKEGSLSNRLDMSNLNKQLTGNRNIELSQRINYLQDRYPLELKDLTYKLANDALIPGYTKAGTQLRLQQVDFNMLEKQLNQMGISRKDPVLWRIGGTLLHSLFPNIKL